MKHRPSRHIPVFAAVAVLSLGGYLSTKALPQSSDPLPEKADVAPATPDEPTDSILFDTTLDDLVVTANTPLVQSDGATLTYNVSEDPDSKSSNTLEILRKVPGVTVDAQDNVKVNGKSSFKIFLNGREDPMLSGNIKTILKSMPAATILKIEVLSEPGAKYESEGVGGILNIVTVSRQTLEGYLANIGISAHNSGGNLYGYGRMKLRNVTASGNISYSNNFITAGNTTTADLEYINFSSETDYRRYSSQESKWTSDYIGGGFDMSWEPDTLNLITVGFNGRHNGSKSLTDDLMTMEARDGSTSWQQNRYYDNHNKYMGYSGQLSYQHTFGRRQHTLVGSYVFDHSSSRNISDIIADISGSIPEYFNPFSENTYLTGQNSHTFQIDYTNPFNGKHLLEIGGKGNLRRNSSDRYANYGPSPENVSEDPAQRVDMTQIDDILAAYASYTATPGKWNLRAGVRYEYTHRGIRYKISPPDYNDFTSIFNDLVPNASVSYNFGTAQNVRAAYQMRISRPGIYSLNPYRNTENPGVISFGNPDLKSGKSHNFSLSYSNYGNRLTGSVKATYYFSRNSVTDVVYASPDESSLIMQTYANVGHYNNFDLDLSLNWSVINNLNAGIWLREAYTNISAESDLLYAKNHGWTTNLTGNVDYTFPFKMRMSLYGGWGSPWIDLQSKGSSWYYYSIGFARSFLKEERLTLNLSLSNFIPPYTTYSYTQKSDNVSITQHQRYRQWQIGFSVSWRLGGLNSDVKKTASKLGDSVVSESNGGGNKK